MPNTEIVLSLPTRMLHQPPAMVPRHTTPSRNRWLKVLAWTLGSLVVLLVVAIIGAKAWINSYLRSPEFRRRMAERSGDEMRSKVEIAPIRFEGTEFFSDGLSALGGPEAKFSDVKIETVRGEFQVPAIWRLLFGDR